MLSKLRVLTLIVAVSILATNGVLAQQYKAPSTIEKKEKAPIKDGAKNFIEAFYGKCYAYIDSLDRIRSLAVVLKWRPLNKDQWGFLGPMEGEKGEGWYFKERGQTIMLGINEAKFLGKDTNICSLGTSRIDAELAQQIFERDFKARLVHVEDDVYQQNRLYEINRQGEQVTVIVSKLIIEPQDTITLGILKVK